MPFNKFISIVFGILGSYYFIIILFDVLKSGTQKVHAVNHTIQFESKEIPVVIADEPERSENLSNFENKKEQEKYISSKENNRPLVTNKSSIVDLGLETLSGDAYTVNAENLSKFMMS